MNTSDRNSEQLVLDTLLQFKGNTSWRSLARRLDVSSAYISDIVNGHRRAGPSLLARLGLRRITLIVPIDTEVTHG